MSTMANEPFWNELHAKVDSSPVMTAGDAQKGLTAFTGSECRAERQRESTPDSCWPWDNGCVAHRKRRACG